MYIIIKEDYNTKECDVLGEYITLENASEYAESEIFNYIIYHEGKNKFKIYDEEPNCEGNLNSRRFDKYDYGHIVLKSNKIRNKYLIYNKEVDKGYLYNSYKVKLIFVITISKYFKNEKKEINKYSKPIDIQIRPINYENVLDELKKNKKFLSAQETIN